MIFCIEYGNCVYHYDCCKFDISTILLKLIFIEIINILLCKSENEIIQYNIVFQHCLCNIWAKHEKNLQQCIARKYDELQSIYIHVNQIM